MAGLNTSKDLDNLDGEKEINERESEGISEYTNDYDYTERKNNFTNTFLFKELYKSEFSWKPLKRTSTIISVEFGIMATFIVFFYLITGFIVLYRSISIKILFYEGITNISIAITLLILIFYLGFKSIKHPWIIITYYSIGYYVLADIWNNFIHRNKTDGFPGIFYSQIIISIILLIGALVVLIHVFLLFYRRIKFRKNFKKILKNKNTQTKPIGNLRFLWSWRLGFADLKNRWKRNWIKLSTLWIILIINGIYLASCSSEPPAQMGRITIKPPANQISFAFWASINPEIYTDEQKETLDRYHALLITYDNPVILDNPIATEKWVNICRYWQNNYPNVQIMAVAQGIPGGFVWDGSANGTIALSKAFLNTALEENLTNVIGINTDQEKPNGLPDNETYRDRDRNEEATRLWNEFFEWAKNTYPEGRFEYQTTFGMDSVVDVFDGDTDVDVYLRNNVLSVEGWDEFAPMIYEGSGNNYEPDVVPADGPHFRLYQSMYVLKEGLKMKGLEDKIGVYIGITNQSVFGADNKISLFGKPAGTGFDALVTQSLIAKSFGIKRLTIFILNTVPENGHLMGGVFESYGDDFLDRLNESINGPNCTKPFDIPYLLEVDRWDAFQMDFWLNSGFLLGYFIVMGLIIEQIIVYQKNKNKEIEKQE